GGMALSSDRLSHIVEGLWLSGVEAVANHSLLTSARISHLLGVVEPEFNYASYSRPFEFPIRTLRLDAEDSLRQDLTQHFTKAAQFIHEARAANGQVLVHCLMGISRSVTIVCAYLIALTGLSVDDVIAAVKTRRILADPNPNFLRQLHRFGQSAQAGQLREQLLRDWPETQQMVERDRRELVSLLKLVKRRK
ncbi:hypothetical protein BOX15_Mlig002529g3, partial [Macrostomum lignano]